jgi:superfamily II DNA helicase RecQ
MYQLIIVSPELLLNDKRFEMLWRKKQFTDSIVNFVLDEAHVIKEWGGTFRSDYLKIGPIRYLFPRMLGFHLGSATIGPALLPELVKNLHLQTDNYR